MSADAMPSEHPLQSAENIPALLLDLTLEVSLRFGTVELQLSDLLALRPGSNVDFDRQISDPVEMVVSDRVVARGEVVLANGYFAFEIAEVCDAELAPCFL